MIRPDYKLSVENEWDDQDEEHPALQAIGAEIDRQIQQFFQQMERIKAPFLKPFIRATVLQSLDDYIVATLSFSHTEIIGTADDGLKVTAREFSEGDYNPLLVFNLDLLSIFKMFDSVKEFHYGLGVCNAGLEHGISGTICGQELCLAIRFKLEPLTSDGQNRATLK